MNKFSTGFGGLNTAVPSLAPQPLSSDVPSSNQRPEIDKYSLVGEIPKLNTPANLLQIFSDFIAFISIFIIIISFLLYSWSIYCDYEYQKIMKITNAKIVEQIPLQDEERVLNKSELLYCLAEIKRLETHKKSFKNIFLFWRLSYKDYKKDFDLKCAQKRYKVRDLAVVEKIYDENVELYERQGSLR